MDSLKLLPQITDNYFDLCLTDPPYNVGKDYGKSVNDNLPSDEYKEWSIEWFKEAKRISRAVIFTPGWKFTKMWLTEIEYPRGMLAWYHPNKTSKASSPVGGRPHWEPYLVYGKINIGKNCFLTSEDNGIDTFFDVVIERQKWCKHSKHPSVKPLNLIKEIIRRCWWKEDKKKQYIKKVIDPFMGIGTTPVACKMLGIGCLGIDIEQKWVDEANWLFRYDFNLPIF